MAPKNRKEKDIAEADEPPAKKKALSSKFDVPFPRSNEIPSLPPPTALRTGNILKHFQQQQRRLAFDHLNNADVFVVDALSEELEQRPKNTASEIASARAIMDSLQAVPAQVQSAIFVDREGNPLLGYYAHRSRSDTKNGTLNAKSTPSERRQALLARAKDIAQQYEGRTSLSPSIPSIYEGLPEVLAAKTYQATQYLAAAHHPVVSPTDVRHRPDEDELNDYRILLYPTPTEALNDYPSDGPRYLNAVRGRKHKAEQRDVPEDAEQPAVAEGMDAERTGVVHLAHTWHQLATSAHDLINPSSAISDKGPKATANRTYMHLTREVAVYLGMLFLALFPEFYYKFETAFKAGVWLHEDPGPWLARAVVYKLQLDIHRDGQDGGPTASFPCGYFKGGAMVFTDLAAKLAYHSGHVCLSLSANLYHATEQWVPVPCPPEVQAQQITPGRVGTVFFTPAKTLETLEGKPEGWMVRTGGGLYPEEPPPELSDEVKAIIAAKKAKKAGQMQRKVLRKGAAQSE
ncbi:hypothetical protein C8R45DRAFT_1211451 [Mycena sanguinolenta]|nr:hypothetical protein C8R45DRAFT_1211451 [Mycena sanguinolenta]